MRKFMLAHMIEAPKIGDEFEKWPLHVTLIPWFEAEDTIMLEEQLELLTSAEDAFTIRGGIKAMLGEKANVPAFLIEDLAQLKSLHNQLYNLLNAKNIVIQDQTTVGDKYVPHITDRTNANNLTGVEFPFDTIDLVEQVGNKAKSIYRFEFRR